MSAWMLLLVTALLIGNIILFIRLRMLHCAIDRICNEFSARLGEDTNVGIDISIRDKYAERLAACLDRQLKLLRQEHIRYVNGDREVKNAITNISHDLRTPLTAISGYLEMLMDTENGPDADKRQEYLSVVANRVHAMRELTEELFRYSVAVSAGSYEEREDVNLNSAIEQVMADYYAEFKHFAIEPDVDLCKEVVVRRLNRQALGRILSNIVQNAIKYSDGDFTVILTEDGNIIFRNQADKLNVLEAERLFDRFYTVQTGKRSTGLGLSIAKLLTEEMGGRITADYADGRLCITLRF